MVSRMPTRRLLLKFKKIGKKSRTLKSSLEVWRWHLPGPSSTERGLPVRNTGSPTVRPANKEEKLGLGLLRLLGGMKEVELFTSIFVALD